MLRILLALLALASVVGLFLLFVDRGAGEEVAQVSPSAPVAGQVEQPDSALGPLGAPDESNAELSGERGAQERVALERAEDDGLDAGPVCVVTARCFP